jgi:hypothetical protein
MHAAGVFRDVAADGTGNLRGRIGRVIQAQMRHRFRDGQIAHARLHARQTVFGVDFQNPVETRQRQDHAIRQRQRAARQTGAGAARNHRYFVLPADPQHRLRLL